LACSGQQYAVGVFQVALLFFLLSALPAGAGEFPVFELAGLLAIRFLVAVVGIP
jgi:hypothetical protein